VIYGVNVGKYSSTMEHMGLRNSIRPPVPNCMRHRKKLQNCSIEMSSAAQGDGGISLVGGAQFARISDWDQFHQLVAAKQNPELEKMHAVFL
jgi:hypothetical protein